MNGRKVEYVFVHVFLRNLILGGRGLPRQLYSGRGNGSSSQNIFFQQTSRLNMATLTCCKCGLAPDNTQHGRLPPWEVAKAVAYSTVISDMAEHMGQSASELIGGRVDEYIAKRLKLVGGGNPTPRAVRDVVAKCRTGDFYPGKPQENPGGRKRIYTEHQMSEAARVGMALKKRKLRVSLARVRCLLPKKLVNPDAGRPMSDWKIREVFQTRCFDEDESDPWQWLPCASKDFLTEGMKVSRLTCCTHVVNNFAAGSWSNQLSIDPCSTLLPRVQWRLDEMQHGALGKMNWRSKKSLMDACNSRAPATANTQSGNTVLQVHWTPIFARGKISIFVCDPFTTDDTLPPKLNDSVNLAKFVRRVLPDVLEEMRREHGWSSCPRVVVHDKASYMVSATANRLNPVFGGALAEAGFRSWAGAEGESTAWLCGKLGDVFPHETAISHIRRFLMEKFVCTRLNETVSQFKLRMRKVQHFMNSPEFSADARATGGSTSLACALIPRCREVLNREGGRIPK